MKILENLNINPGTRVLLRADFNVAMQDGKIAEDFRIKAVLPTIKYLQKKGAKIIILSHLGRPEGKFDQRYSLMPVAEHLSKLLKVEVKFFEQIEIAESEIPQMTNGEIAILENLRFDKREEEGDEGFAKELAELGDVYINDAFGVAHREHASVVALSKLLPHAAGLLLQKEIKVLDEVRNTKKTPLVFVMGGAKVKTKLKTLTKLFDKLDAICVGGLIANTILHAKGVEIGKSWREEDMEEYLKKLDLTDTKLHLPLDAVVSADTSGKAKSRITAIANVAENEFILDAGPDTVKLFSNIILSAGMVVWNGPLGLIEVKKFRKGTEDLAKVLKNSSADIIVGGGDIMRVVDEVSSSQSIYHQSTGGGAMLEYLAEGTLPSIEILK